MKKPNKSSLVRFALLLGGIAIVAETIAANKSKWEGLSESEVRDKVASKMPERVPDEKKAAVADRVVGTMRSRGLLADETDAAEGAAEAAEESDGEGSEEPNA